MIGETVLHYKILEKLGEGGMGVVYKGEDTKLKREVAIKFLPHQISTNYTNRQRFESEAQAAASLNHPNITTIHSIEEVKDEVFIVMEYVKGKELKTLVETEHAPALSIKDITTYAIQISGALEAAHKKGIIHRDIKSQNIMITDDGIAKIMDFGLAKIKGQTGDTKTGFIVGTISYMSPEQALGDKLDHRTDIFSFGVILYEMISGQLPFRGVYEQAIVYSIINEDPIPIQTYYPECPSILSDLVVKCLKKNKEERFNSFREISNELMSFNNKKEYILQRAGKEKMGFTSNFILQKSDLCIGRETELEILNGLLRKVKQSMGRTVFISGEPGIGKTQLVFSVVKNFTDSDFNIFYGRCLYNNEGGLPYHPFINAIKSTIADDDHSFINLLSGVAADSGINISHRIPLIKSFLNLSEEGTNPLLHKEQLWDAVFTMFKTIAVNKPLILIIDDIQWADKVSLGLFSFIARNIHNMPIAIIGIHRLAETILDFDTSDFVELIRHLNIEDLAVNISLERLNEKQTSEIIRRLFNNQSVDKKLNFRIFQQSEGNPLFISELVNLMKCKDLVEFEEGSWRLKRDNEIGVVSKKVKDVIWQRIDYLDNKTKEILQVASCEGEYFQSDILSGVLNISRLELLKLLQSLEKESQIIRHEGRLYRFDHILIREVLYDSIITELKEEYHSLISQWLIENYGNKDDYALRISHQLILAGKEVQSMDYLLRAANRARDLYAVEEALNNYKKLIAICENNGIVNDKYSIAIEEGLGDVYISLGKSEDALKHYQNYLNIAKNLNDDSHIIRALRKSAECNRIKGNIDNAVSLCNEALELAEKINTKNEIVESLNTLAFINATRGDYKKTIENSERALNLGEELNDQKNKSISLSNLGHAYWHLGNYPFAMEKFNKAISIQRTIGDNRGLSTTLNFLGLAYWKIGKFESGLKCAEESVEIKNKIGDYRKIPGSLNLIGDIYRDVGDIKKAISYHEQSLKLASEHQNKGAMCDNIRDLGEDHFLLGDFKKALEYYTEVLELAISSKIKWYEARTYISLSELYLAWSNLAEAKLNIKSGINLSYEIGAKDLMIEAQWNQAKIYAKENLLNESNQSFLKAIQIAKEAGHWTFLWKLLYDYGYYLSENRNKGEAKLILSEAKGIALTIVDDIKDKLLKNTFRNSGRIKDLISTSV